MTEEEIIERVNFVITNKGCTYTEKDYIAIECLLDLYNKQKEETEYYKTQNENKGKLLNTSLNETRKHCISKDEVLKALGYEENDEEYDRLKQDDEKLLAILDTLYSEVCRLEDIEDKKVEVAVDFIEEKRDKYWRDKIREIIGWNIVIKDEKSNNYRPIKNTSAQDVYEAFYKIRKLLKKPHNVSKDKIREYVNSPEFLDWHLGFTLLDELEYRKNNINELLEEK